VEVLDKIIKELPDHLVEAIISKTITDELSFEDNNYSRANSGEQIKLEIRVTKGLRSGYAWTNNLSKWRECLLRANKLMKASSELKLKPIISKSTSINKSFIDPKIKSVDIGLLKSKGENLINSVKSLGVNVPQLNISKESCFREFLNSNLTSFKQDQSKINIELECGIKDSSAWDVRTSQGLNIDFEELGGSTAQVCKDSLNGEKINPGLFNVVFDFGAISELMNILLPSVLANNIIEHNSFLEGKINQQVISKLLTIKDSGVIPDGVNNSLMDLEGTPINEKLIFHQGVLKTFLNDNYTAQQLKVKPTGNSAGLLKRGFETSNNILINPGDASKEELLDNCIYVKNLMGSHTANTVSGDFALNALNVFKYEKGEKTPVRDVLVSGNIFKLLNQVIQLGKTSRFDMALKTPLIKFEKVQLIG